MKLRPSDFLCDLPVYRPGRPIEEVARELGLRPEQVIKLASNENPLGPSPRALEAMRKLAGEVNRYPDGSCFHLRAALSRKLGVGADQIAFGNGSNEIIELAGHAFLRPGDEVIVSQYAFAIYELVARMFQAKLVETPALGLGHDLEAMLGAVTPRTRVMFVANPNNPTGTAVAPECLRDFVRRVPEHVLLVLDEAYQDFLEESFDSIALLREDYASRQENLLVMRTFSKAHGLAGLRLGFGVGSSAVVQALEKVRQPFNVSAMAQAAALAALEDQEHLKRTFANNLEGRKALEAGFRRLGLDFTPSFGNFVLVRVGEGQAVFERLLKQGVIVRPMGGYKLASHIRVSVGTAAENGRFLEALARVLKSK